MAADNNPAPGASSAPTAPAAPNPDAGLSAQDVRRAAISRGAARRGALKPLGNLPAKSVPINPAARDVAGEQLLRELTAAKAQMQKAAEMLGTVQKLEARVASLEKQLAELRKAKGK